MTDATFVLIARKALRARLRDHLKNQAFEAVSWRERRRLFSSEFLITGPSREAREAHRDATLWLNRVDAPG